MELNGKTVKAWTSKAMNERICDSVTEVHSNGTESTVSAIPCNFIFMRLKIPGIYPVPLKYWP